MTTSTTALELALRTRLLTFTAMDGATLADTLGTTATGAGSIGALFWEKAPDKMLGPDGLPLKRWGIARLANRRSRGDGQDGELAELEVMLFARPRSEKATLEACADCCDQAMLRYADTSSGVIGCWGKTRSTLPPLVSPADTEVVQIRLVYTLVLWPAYLTQYSQS